MNIGLEQVEMHLDTRQIVRLYDPIGTRLACVRGALWITQHDDRDDHLIGAGDTLRFDRPGLVLIHAVEPTEFVLSEPAARPSLPGRIARALVAALRAAGRWIARRFGPEAINDRHWRGWYGAL
jgi:hypothetical protein